MTMASAILAVDVGEQITTENRVGLFVGLSKIYGLYFPSNS